MTIGLGGNVGGGGGATIGDAVTGGTANRVLYIDASGNLANDADLTFNGTTLTAAAFASTGGTYNATGSLELNTGAGGEMLFSVNGARFAYAAATFFTLASACKLGWTETGQATGTVDLKIYRSAAGALEITDNANGKALGIKSLTELTTIAAAATTDTTIQIPANAIVLAVSVRVTTVIPTAATFTVIGTASSTAFNTAAVSTAATSTDKGTAAGAFVNTTAQTIRITPNAQPADNTGRVRVTIHYIEITPPTS